MENGNLKQSHNKESGQVRKEKLTLAGFYLQKTIRSGMKIDIPSLGVSISREQNEINAVKWGRR